MDRNTRQAAAPQSRFNGGGCLVRGFASTDIEPPGEAVYEAVVAEEKIAAEHTVESRHHEVHSDIHYLRRLIQELCAVQR